MMACWHRGRKFPWWDGQLQCWFLRFPGRLFDASESNFELVASPEQGVTGPAHEIPILQFGKVWAGCIRDGLSVSYLSIPSIRHMSLLSAASNTMIARE
ncbi:hypothetical protein NL676_023402 [Syzygium grande]|nr:hypothetical protein NL676_023402 [Syzygium grande]